MHVNEEFEKQFCLENISNKYPNIVRDDLSLISATLSLKSGAKLCFLKYRSVPFRLLNLINKKLNFWEEIE